MVDDFDQRDDLDDDDEDATRVTDGPDEALLGALQSQQHFLVIMAGPNVGEMCRIEGEAVIGRDKAAGMRILGDGISRRHCLVRQLPMGKLLLEDLKSTNGTFANGARIDKTVLDDGDKVQIGSETVLKFAFTDGLDEEFQRNMFESALRDGLTKAFNKRYFTERIETEFTNAKRTRKPLSLMMMDIDHFKRLNDNWGHPAGDFVLQTLVQVVEPVLGEDDIFCRYGGEEFSLITPTPLEVAGPLADRVRQAIADHEFLWEGERLPVQVSMGVAGIPAADFATPFEMLSAADAALYVSKEGGRNRVTVHGAGG